MVVSGACATWLVLVLKNENRKLERMENEDVELSEEEVRKLEKTAFQAGTSIQAARSMQKGFRYVDFRTRMWSIWHVSNPPLQVHVVSHSPSLWCDDADNCNIDL